MQCTPPPPPTLINACPEPLWKKYAALQSYQVKAETARLEALLAAGDTAVSDSGDISDSAEGKKLSTFEIRQRLYELSIHHANPDYDFNKIFDYVSFLYQHGGPDSLHYLNWGRVVRDHNTLLAERDSLKTVVTAISEGEKKGSISVENQKKEIRGCLKQIDSLNSVIKTQQEMIVKLQNIDVMMEKQRGRGQ